MSNTSLLSVAEVANSINQGRVLLLAGDEILLSQLPAGKWIGGTSVNFISSEGGVTERNRVFVTDISDIAQSVKICAYSKESLERIGADYADNGFTVIIAPGMSEVHAEFAKNVQSYDGVFNAPLIGWISGVHLSEIGVRSPKCFAGSGAALANAAVAMHIALPAGRAARPDIVNLFTQGDGDAIEFNREGFESEGDCRIGGANSNLARYIRDRGIDTKLPLVADYNGAMINVSVQSVDPDEGKVAFYAPVFQGVKYRFAKPVPDYAAAFRQTMNGKSVGSVAFSCNCILNYAYADLEGQKTDPFRGPITFGEVAYMLLNQTLAFVSIDEVAAA